MPRHASTHAAGVVITPEPTDYYLPLATNDGLPVTQFNMTEIEELGLLKMDFLGLKTLSIIKEAVCMEDLLEISCGLDIHKEKIVACILTGPLGKPTHSEIREFTTLIPDMLALRDWIISENCHHIAMESTGIYWIPIYEILEDAFSGDITLLVVNARHMKNVPGKKTDMRDSEWISTLLRAGLLNASFIPEKGFVNFVI